MDENNNELDENNNNLEKTHSSWYNEAKVSAIVSTSKEEKHNNGIDSKVGDHYCSQDEYKCSVLQHKINKDGNDITCNDENIRNACPIVIPLCSVDDSQANL